MTRNRRNVPGNPKARPVVHRELLLAPSNMLMWLNGFVERIGAVLFP